MSIAYWCCTIRGGDGLAYCAENKILRDGNTFENLYKSADNALYVSNRHGKNQLTFYKKPEKETQ